MESEQCRIDAERQEERGWLASTSPPRCDKDMSFFRGNLCTTL